MRIPKALEEMVAGLISDETKKREEIEAVLSEIHKLTEGFYAHPAGGTPHAEEVPPSEPEFVPQELSDAQRVENFTKAFIRKGMPPDRARDAAEEECGLRDGRM